MLIRIKQFFSALQADITEENLRFIDHYLSAIEKELFFQMDIPTQKHCIRVAETSLSLAENWLNLHKGEKLNKTLLVKAALLHDIGKPAMGLKTWHRVVIVLAELLLPARVLGKLSSQKTGSGLRFAFYLQKYHPKLGGNLAKEYGLEAKLIQLIQQHHTKDKKLSSLELKIPQKADDLN